MARTPKAQPTRADLERELVAEEHMARIDPDDPAHAARAAEIRPLLAGTLPGDPDHTDADPTAPTAA